MTVTVKNRVQLILIYSSICVVQNCVNHNFGCSSGWVSAIFVYYKAGSESSHVSSDIPISWIFRFCNPTTLFQWKNSITFINKFQWGSRFKLKLWLRSALIELCFLSENFLTMQCIQMQSYSSIKRWWLNAKCIFLMKIIEI